MPTSRTSTPTVDYLLDTYTPISVTGAQWTAIADDLKTLVRSTDPGSYWRAKSLLSTTCRFISLISPDGAVISLCEALTHQQLARHTALSRAAGSSEKSLANERGRLARILDAHLGIPRCAPSAPKASVAPLPPESYAELKAELRGEQNLVPTREEILAGAARIHAQSPALSRAQLGTAWVLDVLNQPGTVHELVPTHRPTREDLALALPHLGAVNDHDLTVLRDGRTV